MYIRASGRPNISMTSRCAWLLISGPIIASAIMSSFVFLGTGLVKTMKESRKSQLLTSTRTLTVAHSLLPPLFLPHCWVPYSRVHARRSNIWHRRERRSMKDRASTYLHFALDLWCRYVAVPLISVAGNSFPITSVECRIVQPSPSPGGQNHESDRVREGERG